MKNFLVLITLLFGISNYLFSEGSKDLTPSATGTANGSNTFIGYLQTDDGGNSGDFLKSTATDDEKLYVYIRNGETLYYGIRRFNDGGTPRDLRITIYNSANVVVMQTILQQDGVDSNTLLAASGVIASYAEAAAGPSAIVGGSGYDALSYINTTGTDQDFWVAFDEVDDSGIVSADQDRSWYDLWDFSVYDGTQERVGRLHAKSWSFSAGAGAARLSTEFQLFTLIDGVGASGFYVKEVDLQGIQPFGMLVYANSTGADPAALGTTDFQELRRSQTSNVALPEYEIFVNNPDIVQYPTATLPTVNITDFNTICNADGTASAAVTFESNLDGIIGLLIDVNGTPGYQNGTTDVILEEEVTANIPKTLIWNGRDGLGAIVTSGSNLSVTGRYTAGPVHIPLWDVENNTVGITMSDVRPATTFDQIFWDDSNSATFNGGFTSNPQIELNGTNTTSHTWSNCNNDLIGTWSYGYLQLNSQTVNFTYDCDDDGDGVGNDIDYDSDNDGIPDSVEGDIGTDTDDDGIPDYLDADAVGFVDANGDGVDDNFDADRDGVPNALDLDSDNDGIPDVVETGGTDADGDGREDTASPAFYAEAEDAAVGSIFTEVIAADASGGSYLVNNTATELFTDPSGTGDDIADNRIRFSFDIALAGNYRLLAKVRTPSTGDDSFWVRENSDTDAAQFNNIASLTNPPTADFDFVTVYDVDNGSADVIYNLALGTNTIDFFTGENGAELDAVYLVYTDAFTPRDTDSDGVADYLDSDSDNDGIVDATEAGGSADPSTGTIAGFVDSDGNGWNDDQEIFPLPLTNSDTDVSGTLEDYRDLDSDDDGIVDNREGQNSQVYNAPGAFTDSDGDGLNDSYDPSLGGTLIDPVNTDGIGSPDYQDTDADDDGVEDVIEGFDNDRNGLGDWDTDADNVVTDEVNYNADSDGDGLRDVFDTELTGAAAGIGNVTASNSSHQNTDNAGNADWQDTDDDDDGILTSGEDDNANGNFADDRTQGQSGAASSPDYLFNRDYDGDGIADGTDLDSDNDGILDIDEDGGTGFDPSGDEDADGILNYQDASDATITAAIGAFVDVNADGVDDRFDRDQDAVPDFLDVDADNDGLYDAYEANNGVALTNFNTDTGQFNLNDADNDGLMNQIDNNTIVNGGASTLPKEDFDADGIDDYLDLDSDNDGIPDNIEFQAEGSYNAPSGNDTDGDGIDNAYDPDDSGTLITPTNTDGSGDFDYRDEDADDDSILDRIESSDADNDGFGDWDDNNNGLADEADYSTDSDSDGIVDAFDDVTTIDDVDNITGSNAALQNTDGLDNRDWRDTNDDNDGYLTIDEDNNGNGNYTDDRTNGQGGGSSIPDYLFKGDTDGDLIADEDDTDSDNDGIPDVDEAGTLGLDPSADADGDGIPNYRDSDIAGFTDANGDGVDDRGDKDRDGVPDYQDLDSDNDGIPDAVEANNGVLPPNMEANGQYPSSYVSLPANDPDGDGFPLDVDPDDGGTALANEDHDSDGINDYLDLDSDNDGIPDISEGGGSDSDGDGRVDAFVDVNNNGLADMLEPDLGGTALTYPNSDSDTFADYFDADSDGDGIADATEQGGLDTDANGQIDDFTDTDNDGLSDNVDTDNGGTALVFNDQDGDGLENNRDLDSDNDGLPDIIEAGGTDANADGLVDGTFVDANNNGYDDAIELAPLPVPDRDNDGNPDFVDIDADNDGIVDVIEIGETADATGRIDGFADSNTNGLNDAQEGSAITPVSTDSDGIADHLDMDSDNDGIVDNIEAQTKTGYIGLSGSDTDGDGLDDSYDPDNGGTLISPTNTDGGPDADYIDTDSDGDTFPDLVEGHDADKNGIGDWDADANGAFDDTGFDTDLDGDGILDIFDTFAGTGNANVTGSNAPVQDTDNDGDFDFQDTDDDGDGISTGDGTGGTEGGSFTDDPDGNIPDYLFNTNDNDGDGVVNTLDPDSDDDGIFDILEDGGVGIDPSADADGDGLLNYEDADFAGFTDSDGNNVDDRYDHDGDGVPDFLDLDSDNDGIIDATETATLNVTYEFIGTLDGSRDRAAPNDLNKDFVFGDNYTFRITFDAPTTISIATTIGDQNFARTSTVTVDGVALAIGTAAGSFQTVTHTPAQASTYDIVITGADATLNTIVITDTSNEGAFGFDFGTPTSDVLTGYIGVNEGSPQTTTTYRYASDSDGDGNFDYQDLDSDNDGLTDNREAQVAAVYLAPVSGDIDNDGLLDVYDDNVVGGTDGTLLMPTDSDGTLPDYIDTDSDGDGLDDIIEGHDADSNGFADWDTDGDNDITDEAGYNTDADGDGLRDIFDTDNVSMGLANTDASNADYQDSDSNAVPDYRDSDDDGDGVPTLMEDANTNGDYTDDFVQGGGAVPDYLFGPDSDGDTVLDNVDGDSDNDGIPNSSEYATATYPVGVDVSANAGNPFGDSDGDGIYNYLDTNDVNFTLTDANSDGVDDRADQDFDGVPNFFDLDSDNDGLSDAIEANNGNVPADYDTGTGRFTSGDADGDGIPSTVDDTGTGESGTPLSDEDFDTDGLKDYLDLDSDEDGISDNQEGQSEARVAPTGTDANGDGWDDAYDGADAITPINTDSGVATFGDAEPDYRDLDADADGVEDRVEGHDANNNGFADWDSGQDDNDYTTEIGFNTDSDGDGLIDLFDNFIGFGIDNIDGTIAALQDTDTSIRDWRDEDDDDDGVSTRNEDFNVNAIWYDDKNQGGGAVPDYLFFADEDEDGIPDNVDFDGDGDGIPNSEENGSLQNPYNDGDSDGIPAFQDSSEAGFVDANTDGVDDRYDKDLDGEPDFLDLDSDNDGIPDGIEANGGQLASGMNNQGQYPLVYTMANDANNNGLVDDVEPIQGGTALATADSDGDGIDDYKDLDSDNDGIPDILEAGGTDANNDGKVDAFGDTDEDGLANAVDPDDGGAVYAIEDLDGDGLPDYSDVDSDNDGLSDLYEANGTDATNDGIVDGVFTDTDDDGWSDTFDSDNGGTALSVIDTDNDGNENYRDLDSDNDAIPDAVERNGGTLPANMNTDGEYTAAYIAIAANDSDSDGLYNDTDGTSPTIIATDADGIPDHLDLDSDNDGIPDILEVNETDTDNNGRIDSFTDTDGDGLADAFDSDNSGTAATIANSDDDGLLPDYRDTDADNDGIPDVVEVNGMDSDNDGLPANPNMDTDGDGWSDTFDNNNGGTALTVVDIDGDGLFGFQDLDSDNDGLSDIRETNGTTDSDNDGLPDDTTDTDGDGWPDTFDNDNGAAPYTYVDTDGDGRNDFADLDSDNDGIPDAIEANGGVLPANMNADGQYSTFTDTDGDGYADDRDSDNGGTAFADPNTDGDAASDRVDLDSDNDGIPDAVEANGGALPANMDANGTYSTFNDSDSDGLHDDLDSDSGGTALAITNTDNGLLGGDTDLPDYRDLDADADGIVDIVEAGGGDSDQDGLVDAFADADGDGLANTVDPDFGGGAALPYTDTDMDGMPNYTDTDSDNDTVSDSIEAFDSNGGGADGVPGISPAGTDSDGDGIDDNFEGVIPSFQNTDAAFSNPDAIVDWLDNDDDGDGIPTADENADIDLSGIPDYLEETSNPCGGRSVQVYPEDADIVPFNGVTEVESDAAIGAPDGVAVPLYTDNDELTIDLQHFFAAGTGTYTLTWKRRAGDGTTAGLVVRESADNITYFDRSVFPTTIEDAAYITSTFTPEVNTRYLRIEKDTGLEGDAGIDLDAIGICSVDEDNDLVADRNDLDDDNDGIPDLTESAGAIDPSGDADIDGILNYEDPDIAGYVDTNADNINDNLDRDLDGVPNHLDLDSDNDGIPDAVEANGGQLPTNMTANGRFTAAYLISNDVDTDGLANDIDTDFGSTALSNPNTDGIGNVDFLDLDSDNDGIPDVVEAGGTDVDTNGQLDGSTDSNGDGLISLVDSNEGGAALEVPNLDGDVLVDYRDADSDNDAIPDLIEAGGDDADGDGRVDTATDTDGDGWADIFDSDNSGTPLSIPDTDGDGNRNYVDLDSDNDGLPDALEANNGMLPLGMNVDGQYITLTDTDGDGLHANVDTDDTGTPLSLPNTDGIGAADYVDLDADNDGIPDIVESGGLDANNDGKVDDATDSDSDGIADTIDPDNGGTALTITDTDSDGLPDYRDLDADNDGIPDIIEVGGRDINGDGLADNSSDNDADGWSNTFDSDNAGTALTELDTDGDGLNNNVDLDTDSDGIADAYEANGGNLPSGMNADGRYVALMDTDGDGLHDNVDTDNSGTVLPTANTDGVGGADFADTDADGDGALDYIEAFDDDENGFALSDLIARAAVWEAANGNPGQYPATDTDTNGVPDWLEDTDGDGMPNYLDPDNATYYVDSDVDGLIDLHDLNSSGVAYAAVSGQPDEDNDGAPNQYDVEDIIALPVELTFFKGEFVGDKIILRWQTATEVDNESFEVQKSMEGLEFGNIGLVKGKGTVQEISNYSFEDTAPVNGLNYYRLKQTDFDGDIAYSEVIAVMAEIIDLRFSIYPNPVPETLYIRFNSDTIAKVELRLTDLKGVEVVHRSASLEQGQNVIAMEVYNIPYGPYYLTISAGGRKVIYKVIIGQ